MTKCRTFVESSLNANQMCFFCLLFPIFDFFDATVFACERAGSPDSIHNDEKCCLFNLLPPNDHKIQNIIRSFGAASRSQRKTNKIDLMHRPFVRHDHSVNTHSRNASIKSTLTLIRRRIDDARRRRWRRRRRCCWWWYVRRCTTYVAARFLWNFIRLSFFVLFFVRVFSWLLLHIYTVHSAHRQECVCACARARTYKRTRHKRTASLRKRHFKLFLILLFSLFSNYSFGDIRYRRTASISSSICSWSA